MKLIHCSDIHLDSALDTSLDRTEARQRREEILQTFLSLSDWAETHEVKAVLIAGDLFDGTQTAKETISRVMDSIRRHLRIRYLYLPGNHEETAWLSRLQESVPDNFYVLSGREGQPVRFDGTAVYGATTAREAEAIAPEADAYNILVMHGTLASGSFTFPDGSRMPAHAWKGKHLDYIALGHLHRFQAYRLDPRCMICYSGCLESRGFDECGKKGFLLVNTEDASDLRFHPFARRNCQEVTVQVGKAQTLAELGEKILEICRNDSCRAEDLLLVHLQGIYPAGSPLDHLESEARIHMLQQMLEEQFYICRLEESGIAKPAPAENRTQAAGTPLLLRQRFIRLVQESSCPDEQKREIIRIGLRALAGEEPY